MKRLLLLKSLLFLTFFVFAQSREDLNKMFINGEYSKLIEFALPLVKENPDDYELKHLLGRAYADNEQFREAVPFLEEAAKKDKTNGWIKGWSLAYLGVCYYHLSEEEKSKKYLEQCISLNATKNLNGFASNWLALFGFTKIYKNFDVVEKEHIVFHFQPNTISKIGNIEQFINRRELAFDSLCRYFGTKVPEKIDVFVWGSREDAIETLNQQLGFAVPGMCIIHTYFDQTAGHELTHVISHYLDNMKTKTRFINEGAAVYFDMTSRKKIEMAKIALQNGNALNIKGMWQNQKSADEYLYPVAGAFVEHLVQSGGKEMFLRLMTNQTIENAYQIYGQKLDSIIFGFEQNFNIGMSGDVRDSNLEKNIRFLDSLVEKEISTGQSGKNPLILLINKEEYAYSDYQNVKQDASKILANAGIEKVNFLKGNSAEAQAMSKLFKGSCTDGIYIVVIGKN